jgi:hypothetical protein
LNAIPAPIAPLTKFKTGFLVPLQVVITAWAGDPVFRDGSDEWKGRGVLDNPQEPVIGLAEGETRWRGMTIDGRGYAIPPAA